MQGQEVAEGLHGGIQGLDTCRCISVCSAQCICAGMVGDGRGSLGSVSVEYAGMQYLCNVDGVQYCRGRKGCMGVGHTWAR